MMVGFAEHVAGKTVLIAGAGCAAGVVLAQGLARAGAQVIVIDREDRRCQALARLVPGRIETLALDVLRPSVCARLGALWGQTPIDLLIHLQPLRMAARLGAVTLGIAGLSRALRPGLRAGQGRSLIVNAVPCAGAGAAERACRLGLDHLGGYLAQEAGGAQPVHTLRLLRAEGLRRGTTAALSVVLEPAIFLGFAPGGKDGVQSSCVTVCAACD
ncbi:hypothetical protein KZZ08_00860 [Roseovarius mucosus]|nr:hypothetical protein [Roseovarius mucosus]